MSRNKHNAVPQIKYDFNRITDRRREPRQEQGEIYFRDVSSAHDQVRACLSGKLHDRK